LRREQQQRLIRKLIRETVERAEVLDDIRTTIRSLLSHADEILSHTRRDYIDIGVDPTQREKRRREIDAFYRSAQGIFNSLRGSLQSLDLGADELLLLNKVDHAEDIIDRVYALCSTLILSSEGMLIE
jgi:hypothetical protein